MKIKSPYYQGSIGENAAKSSVQKMRIMPQQLSMPSINFNSTVSLQTQSLGMLPTQLQSFNSQTMLATARQTSQPITYHGNLQTTNTKTQRITSSQKNKQPPIQRLSPKKTDDGQQMSRSKPSKTLKINKDKITHKAEQLSNNALSMSVSQTNLDLTKNLQGSHSPGKKGSGPILFVPKQS